MKAEEIRIGNVLLHPTVDDVCFKISRDDIQFHRGLANIEDYRPVPITEEILLKCGFIKATDKYKGFISPHFRNGQAIRIRQSNSGNYFYSANNSTNPLWVDSLHQLQNLYFALAGEELNTDNV